MKRDAQRGLTLVEVLLALAVAALVLAALGGLVGRTLALSRDVEERNRLQEEARFALERVSATLRYSRQVLAPTLTNPTSAVLVAALDPTLDRDGDGVADADNDGDGKLNEDPGSDLNGDGGAGVAGVDDDGDGAGDDGAAGDDDEDGRLDEDGPAKGDEDNDGKKDDDPKGGVDDDKDGRPDEDWLDTVAFHVAGTSLRERVPAGRDVNGDGIVDGRDYVEQTIAEGVSRFEVRLVKEDRATQFEVQITLTGAGGTSVSVRRRLRLGGYQ
ncbi:MAG: prepilin-type N-terminal cleavage/methylation domain-containing protein [Deltaproteobacteria bacterium]|nr:prepilin-type N-terminal cleavage/methylation domain-containing protein [Deltaproteobacteria bacterium]